MLRERIFLLRDSKTCPASSQRGRGLRSTVTSKIEHADSGCTSHFHSCVCVDTSALNPLPGSHGAIHGAPSSLARSSIYVSTNAAMWIVVASLSRDAWSMQDVARTKSIAMKGTSMDLSCALQSRLYHGLQECQSSALIRQLYGWSGSRCMSAIHRVSTTVFRGRKQLIVDPSSK